MHDENLIVADPQVFAILNNFILLPDEENRANQGVFPSKRVKFSTVNQ